MTIDCVPPWRIVTSREPFGGPSLYVEGLPCSPTRPLLHLMLLIYIRTGGKGDFLSGRNLLRALYIAGYLRSARYGNYYAGFRQPWCRAFIENRPAADRGKCFLLVEVIASTS